MYRNSILVWGPKVPRQGSFQNFGQHKIILYVYLPHIPKDKKASTDSKQWPMFAGGSLKPHPLLCHYCSNRCFLNFICDELMAFDHFIECIPISPRGTHRKKFVCSTCKCLPATSFSYLRGAEFLFSTLVFLLPNLWSLFSLRLPSPLAHSRQTPAKIEVFVCWHDITPWKSLCSFPWGLVRPPNYLHATVWSPWPFLPSS